MISVIVPIYNNSSTIERCIDSIISQSYDDVEIIMVNDGSSDNSYDICNRYAKDQDNISVINSNHQGVSNARNMALKQSKGEYIVFCDADDVYLPYAFENMLRAIKNTDIAIGHVVKRNAPSIEDSVINTDEAITRFFSSNQNHILGTVYGKLFKRDLIDFVNMFDTELSIGEDALFLLKYLFRCKFVSLTSSPVYHHIENPYGVIDSLKESAYFSAILSSKKMIEYIIQYQNKAHLNEAIQDLFNVFSLLIIRIGDIGFGAKLLSSVVSIIKRLDVPVVVKGIGAYCYDSHWHEKRITLVVGAKNSKEKYVIIWPESLVLIPAIVNMHIHMGDYSLEPTKEYSCTEDFLINKTKGCDYKQSLVHNLDDGLNEGVLTYVYSHKKLGDSPVYDIVKLSMPCEYSSAGHGVMIRSLCDQTVSDILKIFVWAKSNEMPVFMHVSSSIKEDQQERDLLNGSAVLFLQRHGLLGDFVFLIHGSYLVDEELSAISQTRANMVICPMAEQKLHEKTLSIDFLQKMGISWFVGTDSQIASGSSSVVENAHWILKNSAVNIEEMAYIMTLKPVSVSGKWAKPLKQHYIIVSRNDGQNMINGLFDKTVHCYGAACLDELDTSMISVIDDK